MKRVFDLNMERKYNSYKEYELNTQNKMKTSMGKQCMDVFFLRNRNFHELVGNSFKNVR